MVCVCACELGLMSVSVLCFRPPNLAIVFKTLDVCARLSMGRTWCLKWAPCARAIMTFVQRGEPLRPCCSVGHFLFFLSTFGQN